MSGLPLSPERQKLHGLMESLSAGTKVRITWHGGNGPWIYTVSKHYGSAVFGRDDDPALIIGWPSEVREIEVINDQTQS